MFTINVKNVIVNCFISLQLNKKMENNQFWLKITFDNFVETNLTKPCFDLGS